MKILAKISSYIFVLFVGSLIAQTDDLRFDRLSVNDGLSQGSVFDIIQDNYGFMWFATNDGLNRYDGYDFDIFRNDPENSTSLPNNQVTSIDKDSDGNIWVGTNGGGLAKLDIKTKTFQRIPLHDIYNDDVDFQSIKKVLVSSIGLVWFICDTGNLYNFDPTNNTVTSYNVFEKSSGEDSVNKIISIYEDSRGNIWGGTLFKGAFKVNPTTGKIKNYTFENFESASAANTVASIAEDMNNIMWFATNEGISSLDPQTERMNKYLLFDELGKKYPYEVTKEILFDDDNNLWIGTNGGGLIKFDILTKKYSSYTYDPSDIHSISYNTIQTLYIDNTKSLWIGTTGKGISILFPFNKDFATIGEDKDGSLHLSVSSIRAILENDEESFWVGGYHGLVLFNKETGVEYELPFSEKRTSIKEKTKYLINQTIFTLLKDPFEPERYLWIGTEGGGIVRYDLQKKTFLNFMKIDEAKEDYTNTRVYELAEGPDKNIWAGSQGDIKIINPRTLETRILQHIPGNPNSLPEGRIISIYFDSEGKCWIGTYNNGFSIYDKNKEEFTHYVFQENKKDWLLSNTVYSFLEDSQGRHWIATGHGLHLFDSENKKFISFTDDDGLPNNVIYSVLEDHQGFLWMSTNNGLTQFDPNDYTFTNYSFAFGLQGNEFNYAAYYKDKNGNLYFGGTKGVTYFNPKNIEQNPYPPRVIIKDIEIIGDSIKEIVNPEDLSELELNYNDDIVTIEAVALNYQSPQLNRYMYKLEGLSDNWIDLENERFITFTNLSAGEYILQIIASNNDDVWNEDGIQLTVVVYPPYWANWWFIITAILLLVSFIAFLYRYRVSLVTKQKAKLERIVTERTLDLQKSQVELEEVNKSKDKLLSIIAHDMKNPFNSLLGYSEMLVNEFDTLSAQEKKEALSGMATTSKAAYNLLENLLDWSRLQMNKIQIDKKPFHLNDLIHQNLRLASIPIADKKITVKTNVTENDLVYADEYMLNTAIRNLLMNSIKFTNEGGTIILSLFKENNYLKFSIEDNGIGMNKYQIETLLSSDVVQSSKGTIGEKGTGLGLLLCKEFIETNGGKLEIQSELDKGSTFSFNIPLAE